MDIDNRETFLKNLLAGQYGSLAQTALLLAVIGFGAIWLYDALEERRNAFVIKLESLERRVERLEDRSRDGR